MRNKLMAYAYDFVSYLMLQDLEMPIRKIVLFGSVARGDFDKESDIDLFFDISGGSKKKISNKIDSILENFNSSKRIEKWNIQGIKNTEVNIIVGNMNNKKWEELRRSMSNHAIILWEAYSGSKEKGKEYVLVSWSVKAKEPNERVRLARKLYGYKKGKKRYKGLIEHLKAKKISQGVALFPIEHANKLRQLFNEVGVRYSLKRVII